MPTARLKTTRSRAIGKPSPGAWLLGWGYAAWFRGVSGMITVEPSTILTGRPWKSQEASARSWIDRPVRRTSSQKTPSGRRCRASQ